MLVNVLYLSLLLTQASVAANALWPTELARLRTNSHTQVREHPDRYSILLH